MKATEVFQVPQVRIARCLWRQSSCRSLVVVASAAGTGNSSLSAADNLQRAATDLVKELKPPRICTLRAFGEEKALPVAPSDEAESVFFGRLAASVRATAQARDFETLSGRISMLAFAMALGLEYATGNTLFKGVDSKQLTEQLLFLVTTMFTVVSFAAAWAAKREIGIYMSKGCKDIVDSALGDIVDGLFYDDHEVS